MGGIIRNEGDEASNKVSGDTSAKGLRGRKTSADQKTVRLEVGAKCGTHPAQEHW